MNRDFAGRLSAGLLAVACAGAASDATAQDAFPIVRFRVVGNGSLAQDEVDRVLADSTGPVRTLRDVQQAIDRLEAAYRAAGFAATRVSAPEQELTGGVVTLKVSESRLAHVFVKGNTHFSTDNVRASLPGLRPGQPANLRAMSDSIQLANDNPAKQVGVTLTQPGPDGDVDATVSVEDHAPLRVIANVDNTGTPGSGRWRTGLALQHANLFGLDHVGTLAYTTSPDSPGGVHVELWSLGYRVPLYGIGDSVDLLYGRSSVNVPGASPTLGGVLGFTGKGQVFGVHWNLFFARHGERSSKLVLGVDRRETDSSCNTAGGTVDSSDPASAIAACLPYTTDPVSITWYGQQQGADLAADAYLGLSHNVASGSRYTNVDGRRDHYSFLTPGNRDTRDGFTTLRGGASITLALAGDWQVRLAGNGQVASDPLLASEQIGLTGSSAVRGFEERSVSTDSGAFVNAELYTPDVVRHDALPGSLRALVFADAGHGVNSHVGASGIAASATVSSFGAGLRAGFGRDLSARVDVARVGAAGGSATERRGDWHAHVAAAYSF
jgi:hemolysin activation/secretion protein